jgi:hypothetical protein
MIKVKTDDFQRVQESHPAHDVARKMLAKYGLQEGQGIKKKCILIPWI